MKKPCLSQYAALIWVPITVLTVRSPLRVMMIFIVVVLTSGGITDPEPELGRSRREKTIVTRRRGPGP